MRVSNDPRVPDFAPALAARLADAARPILKGYFRKPIPIDGKADDSPVTRADREAEAAMRAILAAEVPGHGIIGEEYGVENPDADYVWSLDPLDGTRAFVSGKPQFGTLVALLHRGSPIVGVMDMPILGERWTGVVGRGATLNGAPARTRQAVELAEARIATTSPEIFADPADMAAYQRLRDQVADCNFGGDCYNYGVLASGSLDVVIETTLKIWDMAALAPVVISAGGAMTDWSGAPLTVHSKGDVVASSDPSLHRAVLAAITEK